MWNETYWPAWNETYWPTWNETYWPVWNETYWPVWNETYWPAWNETYWPAWNETYWPTWNETGWPDIPANLMGCIKKFLTANNKTATRPLVMSVLMSEPLPEEVQRCMRAEYMSPLERCLARQFHTIFNGTLPAPMESMILSAMFLHKNGTAPPEINACFEPIIDLPPEINNCLSRAVWEHFNGTLPAPMPELIRRAAVLYYNGTAPAAVEQCFNPQMPDLPPAIINCLSHTVWEHFNGTLPAPMPQLVQYAAFMYQNDTAPAAVEQCFKLQMPDLAPDVRDCLALLIRNRYKNGTLPAPMSDMIHHAAFLYMNGTASLPIQQCFNPIGIQITPLPSISERPSMSQFPARPSIVSLPSMSVRPSFSSRPSRIPIQPTLRPSPVARAPRTPLPSMSAAASQRVALRRSPMPSPWYVRSASSTPGASAAPPSYIESRLKLPNADPASLAAPAKIQELQASLACTLMMPLENIRIRTISVQYSNGTTYVLPFDPTAYQLSSNGQAGCFVQDRSNGTRLRRRLQIASSQISVDYVIVDPPAEITALTTADLTTVLASSSVLVDVVASVGGTQIEAADVEPAAAPAATTTTAPATQPFNASILGYAATALVVIASIATAVYYKVQKVKKAKEQEKITVAAPVVVIEYQNPVLGRIKPDLRAANSEVFRVSMVPISAAKVSTRPPPT